MNCKLCGTLIDSANKCKAHIFLRGLLKLVSEDEYGNLLIVGTNFDKKTSFSYRFLRFKHAMCKLR